MTVYIKSLCVKNWRVCRGGNSTPQFPKVEGIRAPHATPVCLRFRDLAFAASQPLSHNGPSTWGSRTAFAQICRASLFRGLFTSSLPALPLIQALLTQSSRLYSTILMPPLAFWAFTLLSIWETTFPIKLQLELGPASTSYATLTVTLSEVKTLAPPVLCTTLATSSNSPVLESGVILQYAKIRQDKTTP